VAEQQPLYSVLKLLCLQSLTNGGIKSSKFDLLKREIVQTYGFTSMFKLNVLESIGALKRKDNLNFGVSSTNMNSNNNNDNDNSTSNWQTLRTRLSLINDSVNIIDPDDISYVTSGYAPLSVRFIQAFVKEREKGGGGKNSVKNLVKICEVSQGGGEEVLGFKDAIEREKSRIISEQAVPDEQEGKPVMIVYYVGGVTYMEIASLRFLSNLPREKFPYRILIAATSITNGEKLLKGLCAE